MTSDEQKLIDAMRDSTIRILKGPTIPLGSGGWFDFVDCEATAYNVTLEDFAAALAFGAMRFTGQCRNPVTGKRCCYTVAQHCVEASYKAPGHEFPILMHEAGEGVCLDMSSPLKSLCPDYKAVEKRCEAAMHKRFLVVIPDKVLVKQVDLRMLATEKRDLMPNSVHEEWTYTEGNQPYPEMIVPWTPEEAFERFLARYAELRP